MAKAESFIGWKSDDGNLEVIGIAGKSGNNTAVYNVICNVCSTDTELFNTGIFTSTRCDLLRGKKPCGCSRSPRWDDRQWLIRAQRVGKGRFTILGYSGEFNGAKAKVNLKCSVCENKWNTSILSVVNQGTGCPECAKISIRNALYEADKFVGWTSLDGMLEVLSIRSINKRCSNVYNVLCHACSKDPELFGDGVFAARKAQLLQGMKPCGCARTPRWTEQQFLIRAERASEGRFSVLGYIGAFNGQKTKASVKCNVCDHEWNTKLVNVINKGTGCPECAKETSKLESGMYGFYTNRTSESDNLYVLNFNNQYIKVGRSFDVDRRIKALKRLSGIDNITIITTVNDIHENIYRLEQEIHDELRGRGFHCELSWTTECFDMDSLKLIDKLL